MFVDYYEILEINEDANLEEIKSAFRTQALKWHPDKNPGKDTTKKMQKINEAYLILKDNEARKRYNKEYQKFKKYKQEKNRNEPSQAEKKHTYEYSSYTVDDDILNRWMKNAKNQAVDLAKQTIEDFKGMVLVRVKEGVKGAGKQFVYQIIIGIIFFIIRGCGN